MLSASEASQRCSNMPRRLKPFNAVFPQRRRRPLTITSGHSGRLLHFLIVTTPEYIAELRKNLAHGDATEHTHRPALKSLLESLSKGITATNEPKRIACGAPDFIITRKNVPLGHIETKDVGTPLEE